MLEYMEQNPEIFYAAVFLILIYNLIGIIFGGKKVESIFPDLKSQNIRFREKWASGYSTASLKTKMGGASKVLDVIVTDSELWIKGIIPMFSYIGSKHDLLHKVPLANIQSKSIEGKNTHISFPSESGTTELILQVKASNQFIEAIGG